MTREDAWRQLQATAKAYAVAPPPATPEAAALSEAAKQWAAASKPATARDHGDHSDARIPFGHSRGKLVADADTKDLEWVANALRKSIDDPAKARWVESNQQLLDAIETELETR